MTKKISLALCLLTAAIVSGQVEVQPREAVIVRGGNVSMLCKVAYPIDSCRVRVAGITYNLRPDRIDPTSNLQYNGNGLQSGECGVVINRVDESMNGNITCSIPSESSSVEIEGVMQLVIARAPEQPVLTMSPGSISTNVYLSGDKLQARCEVPHGRPPAKISWFLGNDQLFNGLHQVAILDEPNSDLKTISQNLTRTLLPEDDGASLVCKAEHEALSSFYRAERQLDVQYPPQSLEASQITIFGVKLREDGLLNVTVRANPQPQVTWTVGSVRLDSGDVDPDGKYEARPLQPQGGGFYLVSLLLRGVEKADVDRQYLLTVRNNHGQQDFTVRISTNDEPEAVQLDAGSIVGIVVAALVVIIAVSLAVYARTTHRWCFADTVDGAEPRARSSGESSDTESAVAGPKTERRLLPDLSRALPALRSVLPSRNRKDKVVAETLPDPKPADEEEKPLQEGDKKGVVYAELALPAPAPAAPKPAPEPSEYAEIGFSGQPAAPASDKREA